jgi:uncharacterized membrane protein YkvA (DUF1232 family)
MNQLDHYIADSARTLTREEIEDAVRAIPLVRVELATAVLPDEFPNLSAQVELLCHFVEDVFGGVLSREDAGDTFLEAAFAVRYFHRKVDVIPDQIPHIGKLDDAVVVQTVIRRGQPILQPYARSLKLPWKELRARA